MSDECENSAAKRSLPITMSDRSSSSPCRCPGAARPAARSRRRRARSAAAMCVVGLRPSTSRMRAPSSSGRGSSPGSSAVVLPRVKAHQPPPGPLVDQDERRRRDLARLDQHRRHVDAERLQAAHDHRPELVVRQAAEVARLPPSAHTVASVVPTAPPVCRLNVSSSTTASDERGPTPICSTVACPSPTTRAAGWSSFRKYHIRDGQDVPAQYGLRTDVAFQRVNGLRELRRRVIGPAQVVQHLGRRAT